MFYCYVYSTLTVKEQVNGNSKRGFSKGFHALCLCRGPADASTSHVISANCTAWASGAPGSLNAVQHPRHPAYLAADYPFSIAMICARQVFRCFKTLERWGNIVTGKAGPFFVGLAVILISMGVVCFCASSTTRRFILAYLTTCSWCYCADAIVPHTLYPNMHPHCAESGYALLLRGHRTSRICQRSASWRRKEYLLGEEVEQKGKVKVLDWWGSVDVEGREGYPCCKHQMYEMQNYATRGE